VNLRGITIQGIGFGGGTGLQFAGGFALTMENCVIRNHTGYGIFFTAPSPSNLVVSNTLIADNGADGINVNPSGTGHVNAVFKRVGVHNNSGVGINVQGFSSAGTINATMADSVVANNAVAGLRVSSHLNVALTSLMVVRSAVANNGTGLIATEGAEATLRIGQSSVTGNTTSWSATNGAILRSYGDNRIDGNSDNNPPPTRITKK
jgi:hypothetical protein